MNDEVTSDSTTQHQHALWAMAGHVQLLTDPQVQFLPHIHSITDSLIWLSQVLTGCSDSVGSDLREPGS